MTLIAHEITKSYDQLPILSKINLTVRPNEKVAICGRSGEGKTTLLHILGTLEQPDSGTLFLDSKPLLPTAKTRSHQIGFVFQSYNLLEDFSTLENVLMPARIARMAVSRARGMQLLILVGLAHKADTPAKRLSGGERQRAAIARALCNDPPLILADEPTGNLDRTTAAQVHQILLSLNKTVIIATHDAQLASLCHVQYHLQNGLLSAI